WWHIATASPHLLYSLPTDRLHGEGLSPGLLVLALAPQPNKRQPFGLPLAVHEMPRLDLHEGNSAGLGKVKDRGQVSCSGDRRQGLRVNVGRAGLVGHVQEQQLDLGHPTRAPTCSAARTKTPKCRQAGRPRGLWTAGLPGARSTCPRPRPAC